MSDSGDKTRGAGQGPLPRTNRPRPAPASQRKTVPAGVVPPEGAPEPAPAELPPEPAGGGETRATTREGAAPPGGASETMTVLAERPTQLDSGSLPATRQASTPLRQVELVRAEGSEGQAGPASTYVGYIIDGRYRVEGVLGRGGMGVVYRARHEVIDKVVAVKILLPTEDPDVVERFVNEARAATAIGNAHIVGTVDFGALPDGSTYFVMEHLEGETLARRLKRDKFLSISDALAVTRQIAEGIGAAHRAGIVHRDLKPENIFLGKREGDDDFVKLLDFGIAKIQSAQNRITRAGTIFGTPHYMSPEQAAGKDVDPRTDLYSLGVILYEMLTGRVPFDAENPMGLLTQHLYTEPTPFARLDSLPQELPSALDAIVLKCLAKQREDRYASASELASDLDRVERGEAPTAMAALLSRAERENDRKLAAQAKAAMRTRSGHARRSGVIGLVSVGALLLGGAAYVYTGEREDPASPMASAAPTATAPSTPSPPPVRRRMVSLVFSPIDAEVFRDDQSLGGMPVSVEVPPGRTVEVEVRREGFYPQRITLDGSRPVVVSRLAAIPGVQPMVPVPSGDPVRALAAVRDAGTVSALLAAATVDSGTTRAARPDVGATGGPAATPTPAAPTPPSASAAPGPIPAPQLPVAPAGQTSASAPPEGNLTPPPGP